MNGKLPIASYDWANIAAGFEQAERLTHEETDQIRDALNYLRLRLGEGILTRIEARWGIRHPLFWLLGVPFIYPPTTRLAVLSWTKSLKSLEDCENVGRVLSDFEKQNKCEHAYRLIEVTGALTSEGMKILFEPPSSRVVSRKHADALVEYPPTKERFYLELSCQRLSSAQLDTFRIMSACYAPLWKIGADLRFSGRLKKVPAEKHLDEICRRVEEGGRLAFAERRLIEVADGDTIQMAICPSENLAELESWCKDRGLSAQGFAGPQDSTSASGRLGGKIHAKQDQLPPNFPNVLVLESNFTLHHTPEILNLISELEEEVYKYPHVAIVVVRGGYNTNREELPRKLEKGEHRFERQVAPRHIKEILLLSNRFAQVKPSEELRARLLSAFFWDGFDEVHPVTD